MKPESRLIMSILVNAGVSFFRVKIYRTFNALSEFLQWLDRAEDLAIKAATEAERNCHDEYREQRKRFKASR